MYYQWGPNIEKKGAQGHGASCSHGLPVKLYLFLEFYSLKPLEDKVFLCEKTKLHGLLERIKAKKKGNHLH